MKRGFLTLRDFLNIPGKDIYETAEAFQQFIDQFEDDKAYAFDVTSNTAIGAKMDIVDRYTGKILKTTSFVTNNYLGMTKHPKVISAAIDAVQKYGTGTCAAPPIGGYINIHKALEQKLAKLHGKEDAILFTSGYTANIGVYQLLFDKSDLAIVDMFVHASVYDGLKNNTNIKIFKHNDMDYLEMTLKREQGKRRNMAVIVDGVYSQDGDMPKLPDICTLAEKYGAWVCIDDAHGVGVFGKNGKGTADHFGVEDKIDIVTGTFSKSMGTTGGYAAGSAQLIRYLRHYARSNTFSASLAPPVVAAASKALDLFAEEPGIIKRLWSNTRYLKSKLSKLGFDIGISQSPITPVMIRNDHKTMLIARELLERGIYVIPAIYPAVKLGDSRFRVNVTTQHTKEDLDYFCNMLSEVSKDFNFAICNQT